MAQYSTFNLKLSNLELNKLRSEIKNTSEVIIVSIVIRNSNDETSFPLRILLTTYYYYYYYYYYTSFEAS